MKRLFPFLVFVSLACQLSGHLSPPNLTPASSTIALTANALVSLTPSTPTSPLPTTILPTRTLPLTPTFASYEQYTTDFLRKRTYGGGKIEIVQTLEVTDSFTRYLIRYPSDGLNIYGFVNVPKGNGLFPVIIALHGYVDPANYETLDYTTPAIDIITRAGYIVIHPNLRGYPPSDEGDNLFRVGMAVDVLNLIALIKAKSGPSELFTTAASDHIGLWGHSMGGEVALRVLTVSSDIKSAVLYASLSGDETKNAQLLFKVSSDPTLQTELATSPAILARVSPVYYYNDIKAAIQLHHGTADEVVPVAWAQETCQALKAAGVLIDCIYYPGENHTFRGRVADQFYNAMFSFYQLYLSP